MTIGLLSEGIANWGGGLDLLRLLASGLISSKLHVSLLLPQRTLTRRIRSELGAWKRMGTNIVHLERPRYTKVQTTAAENVIAAVQSSGCAIEPVAYYGNRAGLAHTVAEQGIDVVLPCMNSLGKGFPIPWIGYIPDLQHKYLPQYFSQAEMAQRDRVFQEILREARVLVVNSREVKSDLQQHYEVGNCEIAVLPFTPLLQPHWLTGNIDEVRAKYSLPARYFLISNQFWLHKDHATAFNALSLLGDRDVHFVCTGDTHDYRAPKYFASLERLTAQLGVQQRVRFLGHIPKMDQITMMRDAMAVVQPTLFEGSPGGGSVYDAVGIGTPAIVSDIAVNRDIEDESVEFFRVGSAPHLAEKLQKAVESPRLAIDTELLLERAVVRRERLGRALIQTIDLAMESKRLVMAR